MAYKKILGPEYDEISIDKANEAICTALSKVEKIVREQRIPTPDEFQELYRKSQDSNTSEQDRISLENLMFIRANKCAKIRGTTALKARRYLLGEE